MTNNKKKTRTKSSNSESFTHKKTITIKLTNSAGRYIACDCHAHLVSKTGYVIIGKSPSRVFKWSGKEP